jgi:hypothetical protein
MEPGHDVSRSDVRNRIIGFDFLRPELDQGAHERPVPARKGCIPEAPEGGQTTHAGTLLEGAVAALPEDPPEAAREDDVDPVMPDVPDRLPEAPPEAPPGAPLVDDAPPADPVAEPPVVVLGVA